MTYTPNRLGKSLRSAHDFKIKPPSWGGFSPALIALEWEWFWKGNKSAFLFNDFFDDNNVTFYDYSAGKFRTATTGALTSSTMVSTEFGISWHNNDGDTTHNRYLQLEDDLLNGASMFTILAFLKLPASRDGTNEHNIYDEWDFSKRNVLFRADPATNQLEAFIWTSSQIGGSFSTATDIDDAENHTVALRYDGATLNAFKDGVKDSTSFSASGTIGEAGGNTPALSGELSGTINGGQFIWHCGAIFRVALTDAQIRRWSDDPFGPFRMHDVRAK